MMVVTGRQTRAQNQKYSILTPQIQDIDVHIMPEVITHLPVDQPNGKPPAPFTLVQFYFGVAIPCSGKILRAKLFEVDLPQNIWRIKFRGLTRLSLYLYARRKQQNLLSSKNSCYTVVN